MALSDDVKAEVSLVEVAGADTEWDARQSQPRRGEYFGPCPLHGEATASFHVTERPGATPVFKCFGCGASGTVIDYVMERDGVGFAQAVAKLADQFGIGRTRADAPATLHRRQAQAAARDAAEARAAEELAKAKAEALALWRAATPPSRVTRAYLGVRTGGRVNGQIPPTLRSLPVRSGPAVMIAAVGRSRLAGVHRTWITATGRARDESGRNIPKRMRGPCFGQPVRLTPPDPNSLLVVGEGIETTLAWLLMRRHAQPSATLTAEAALTLGALAGPERDPRDPEDRCPLTGKPLPSPHPDLENDAPGWLPPEGHRGGVLILADPSAKSPLAAERHARRALAKIEAARPGPVWLAIPRGRFDHDQDFADLATQEALRD